jgi:hypothetical protein
MKSEETVTGTPPGHELRDVRFRPIVLAAIGLALSVVVAVAGMAWLFNYLAAREARRSAPASPLSAEAGRREPPEPRLQDAPIRDLRQLRHAEQATLDSYAWVDRDAGIVRIPIEKAMELLAERAGAAARESAGATEK